MIREYNQTATLFKNTDNSISSSLDFMPDDTLHKSLKLLIRDHYIPLSGWIEMKGSDIYLVWDNYKDGIYAPRFPVHFETDSINTSYDEFYKMVQNGDSFIYHSESLPRHTGELHNDPLFFIKVTCLEPDTQAVAVSFVCSHMIMDGCSDTHFYANWATLCRQMQNDPTIQSISDYTIPHPPLFGTIDFSKLRAREDKDSIKKEGTEDIDCNSTNAPISIPKSKGINDHCLTLSRSEQKKIRDGAHEIGVSFNIHLFSILWKEGVGLQFRQAPEIVDNMSSFGIAIDIRSRLGVSMNLCTCAIVAHYIKIKVSDILEMSVADLAHIIKKKTGLCNDSQKYLQTYRHVCFDLERGIQE